MIYEERLAEARRLEQENQVVLATPFMSEGSISPMQVGLFSSRQKIRWQKDAMRKMDLDSQIRQLRLTDAELAVIEQRRSEKAREEKVAQCAIYQKKVAFIEGLGRMSHKLIGRLKGSYQRIVDGYELELARLQKELG